MERNPNHESRKGDHGDWRYQSPELRVGQLPFLDGEVFLVHGGSSSKGR